MGTGEDMREGSNEFSDFFAGTRSSGAPAEEHSFVAVRSVKRSLLAELQSAGNRGTPMRPEELLARWPTDPRKDQDVASILFEDYQQRLQRGEEPSREEYEGRFPEHKTSLAGLFQRRDILASINEASSPSVPGLALPTVGDELFGFRLRKPLGEGAFARVFLAEQADLAGRPVVLKVSNTEGDEPQTLAQMQHTSIVPIYSVHENAAAGLRAVCMPYFGGASLSRVLQIVWHSSAIPAQGQQIIEALEEAEKSPDRAPVGQKTIRTEKHAGPSVPLSSADTTLLEFPIRQDPCSAGTSTLLGVAPETAAEQTSQGALARLARSDYASACVWLVAELADGLQHAHHRGVCHRDIKPSNILLSADGQPMLLDFNLAHHFTGPKAQASATLGGTVAYMAPEHLRALAARDPALVRRVDHRSDIYSLGMVLFEMLAGHSPFQQSASYAPLPFVVEAMALERGKSAPSLRAQRPDLPWGLESILRKCLAPRQEDRYQQAAHFAEDLRRFLDNRPLQFAPELSRRERVEKWLRRHPQVKSSGAIAAIALLVVASTAAAAVGLKHHLTRTREALVETQGRERRQEFDKLKTRAYCLVNTTSDLQDNLHEGVQILNSALGLYGVLDQADWQDQQAWQRLGAEERCVVAEDTRELLLLLAWATVKTRAADPSALREALALLDRAAAIRDVASSPALARDRAHYLHLLGEAEQARLAAAEAEQLRPVSPRDHYLLAAALLRSGRDDRHRLALRELDRAAQKYPGRPDYWTMMQRGICHLEIGQFDLAAADFGVCIGIWPEFAWGHFNRGLALDSLGRKNEAVACYSAALELDERLIHAWWNRGVVHMDGGRPREALGDWQRAAALGRDDAVIHLALGKAHEKLGGHAEADAAFDRMFDRLPRGAANRNSLLCELGFVLAKRSPARARIAFRQVLAESPRDRIALYGSGLAAVEAGNLVEAIDQFTLTLHWHPHDVDARSCRAVLFARLGHLVEASQEVERCRRENPARGATWYDAACVMALAARHPHYHNRAAAIKDVAVAHLREAFARGFGRGKAHADMDLASLQGFTAFEELLKKFK